MVTATESKTINMNGAEYMVLDETTDFELAAEMEYAATGVKKKRGFAVGNPEPELSGDADHDAGEMAKLMKDMAAEAARQGFDLALKAGGDQVSKQVEVVFKDLSARSEKLIAYMENQSKLYAKPQNLCLHVKFNEQKAVKLKSRVCKLLADIMVQVDIGKNGGKWPLIMGPTGSGKTVLAGQVAEMLSSPFSHTNCTEGMSETWIHGRNTPTGFVPGAFFSAYKNGGVFLLDEIDACNDNVLLGINTAIGNGEYYNPMNGETVKKHENFVLIAAANTNGKGGSNSYTGRTRLDAATLNRFSLYTLTYDQDLERELCPDSELLERLYSIRTEMEKRGGADVISTRDIKEAYMQRVRGVPLSKVLSCLALRMDKANQYLFEHKDAEAVPTSTKKEESKESGKGKRK